MDTAETINLKTLTNNKRAGQFCLALFCLCGLLVGVSYAQDIDLAIIAKIESDNDPLAYNKISGARGICQITEICLQDYIEWNNTGYINPTALFDKDFNFMVANWYINGRIPFMLRYYKKVDTIENRLWAYNAGIGMVLKGIMPKETKNYIAKYKRLAK